MAGYVINVGNASVKSWVTFGYEFTLNGMSNAQIGIDGVDLTYSTEFDVDKSIEIYKNGTLIFTGTIIDQDSNSGGGIILTALGIEHELADDKAESIIVDGTTKVYTSTTDNAILDSLVTSVSGWTTNVINSTATSLDSFRVSVIESFWNCIIRLIEVTGKDILIDQLNKKVYLYDELKRNPNSFAFVEGKNANGISRGKSRSKAGKVVVYGKGDGEDQVKGSYGSSVPVYSIIDSNIISDNDADDRAKIEYDKLNPKQLTYNFEPTSPVDNVMVGDSGDIVNNSAQINEIVDIVRKKIVVSGIGVEKISIEVTNPEYRLASKNLAENSARSQFDYNQSQTSMQGSGNYLTYGNSKNIDSSTPLIVNFNIDSRFTDELGNIRVDKILLDYDIDPYNRQYGTGSAATDTGLDVDSGDSGNNTELYIVREDDDTISTGSYAGGSWHTLDTWYNIGSHGVGINLYVNINVVDHDDDDSDYSYYIRIYDSDSGEYYPSSAGVRVVRGRIFFDVTGNSYVDIPSDGSHWHDTGSSTYDYFRVKDSGTNYGAKEYTGYDGTHDHDGVNYLDGFLWTYDVLNGNVTIPCPVDPYLHDFQVQIYQSSSSSYDALLGAWDAYDVVTEHTHDEGTYETESHGHAVSIGDSVSDDSETNASNVLIYLDENVSGTWTNRYSITPSPASELEKDLDISNGGVYPNSLNLWRVRIYTNSAAADYLQARVKIKHLLNN
jgi:hypothetical protein